MAKVMERHRHRSHAGEMKLVRPRSRKGLVWPGATRTKGNTVRC